MKKFVCLLLLAFVANNVAVEAHRRLFGASASSNAVVTSTGGGFATAVATGLSNDGESTTASAKSKADGKGANAKTTAVAKDGADVAASTEAVSKNGAPVKAETKAVGEGEDTVIDVDTKVKSDKPIDVTVFIAKYDNGTEAKLIAVELVKEFEKYEPKRVSETLLKLAGDEKRFVIFTESIVKLFEVKTCAGFKTIVKGFEDRFIVFKLPEVVTSCIYTACSSVESAKMCCGEAQLKQDQCACADGKCLWGKSEIVAAVGIWKCKDCGVVDLPFCVCL